jgi:16S rRNA (uracil1498-N3)-methyltransferase
LAQAGRATEEVHLIERAETRLYIPQPLTVGVAFALDTAQSHRLRNVLRLDAGAAVAAFNERDGEWLCRLTPQGRRGATLAPEHRVRAAEAEPDLWLLFAPIKRARLDWLIEKATELGAAVLVPVWTARTQPERLNRERLQALAIAAAEQSERLSVPEIRMPETLDRVLADWAPERRLIVCDETGAGTPIAAALEALPTTASAALLIGPEGGFAETAALAALAVFQAIAGGWRRARPR